jgi:hypothetical protein
MVAGKADAADLPSTDEMRERLPSSQVGFNGIARENVPPMTPKRPKDPNQLATAILDSATGQVEERSLRAKSAKAEGGSKGGMSRAAHLTPEQRSEAASLAAQARWRRKID